MFELSDAEIDVCAVENAVRHSGAGALLTFRGDTREDFEGRKVVRLEYEAYAEMAVPQMQTIGDQVAERWPGARVSMVHRLGVVPVGETSVVISVSAPHRDACYAASRFAIDSLKAQVPIFKKEIYEDGSCWKQNQGVPG
jgi:molybdopterin synthase catalytic subunit